ncbi:MAG: hypothetical protein V4525_11885 [Pseudomonadota bacterium]
MSKQIETLAKARLVRSNAKRRAVESIAYLQERNKTVTFVAISQIAKVSRAYLYVNFKDEYQKCVMKVRVAKRVIDGVKVPDRSYDGFKAIEAALKNKINRLQTELGEANTSPRE